VQACRAQRALDPSHRRERDARSDVNSIRRRPLRRARAAVVAKDGVDLLEARRSSVERKHDLELLRTRSQAVGPGTEELGQHLVLMQLAADALEDRGEQPLRQPLARRDDYVVDRLEGDVTAVRPDRPRTQSEAVADRPESSQAALVRRQVPARLRDVEDDVDDGGDRTGERGTRRRRGRQHRGEECGDDHRCAPGLRRRDCSLPRGGEAARLEVGAQQIGEVPRLG